MPDEFHRHPSIQGNLPLGLSDILDGYEVAQAQVKHYAELLAAASPDEEPQITEQLARWQAVLAESASLLRAPFAGPLRYRRPSQVLQSESRGQEIERLRTLLGWSQDAVASTTGFSTRTVIRAEKDKASRR